MAEGEGPRRHREEGRPRSVKGKEAVSDQARPCSVGDADLLIEQHPLAVEVRGVDVHQVEPEGL